VTATGCWRSWRPPKPEFGAQLRSFSSSLVSLPGNRPRSHPRVASLLGWFGLDRGLRPQMRHGPAHLRRGCQAGVVPSVNDADVEQRCSAYWAFIGSCFGPFAAAVWSRLSETPGPQLLCELRRRQVDMGLVPASPRSAFRRSGCHRRVGSEMSDEFSAAGRQVESLGLKSQSTGVLHSAFVLLRALGRMQPHPVGVTRSP